MNSLKNLLIIGLLGAVGYGVYTSLERNNVEPARPGTGWPEAPKVELSDAKLSTTPGGPLALGTGSPPSSAGTPTATVVTPGPATPAAPPLTSSEPSVAPTAVLPVMPYPSSAASPANPPANPPVDAPLMPTATLGQPMAADPTATPTPSPSPGVPAEGVHNLAPPPFGAVTDRTPEAPEDPARDSFLRDRFSSFMEAVQKSLDEGKLAEAHLALSSLYGNPDLPPDQAKQITDLLDQLAGTVIYSRKHYLEPPYMPQPGDTLDSVARAYNVPWQLLGRINGLVPAGPIASESPIKDQPLTPGQELKVVRGPFDAMVDLDKHELTLMVQKRYAGRFRIGVGRDEPKLDGDYTVHDKTPSPSYRGPDGLNVGPNDPQNPLGTAWIGLTDRIGIHGTNDPGAIGRDDNRGAICVGDRDLQDLYGILSVGSRVTVLR